VETIGSKRSYALTWCMPNNDDDDDDDDECFTTVGSLHAHTFHGMSYFYWQLRVNV